MNIFRIFLPWTWFRKKEPTENQKEQRVKFIDREIIREVNHIRHSIKRRPKKVEKLVLLIAQCQAKLNQGISAGTIKNKDRVNQEIQRANKEVEEAREKNRAVKNKKQSEDIRKKGFSLVKRK